MTRAEISNRDLGIAALLWIAFATLYVCTQQGRVFGNDGAMLCNWAVFPERAHGGYHNVLYPWLSGWFTSLFSCDDPLTPVRVLQSCATADGLAFGYLSCRSLAASRFASVASIALLGTSPAIWFFATTVEVHAVHFGLISFCAFVILHAPWHRPALGIAAAGLVLPFTYLSHQSAPALGLGWLLLAQCGRLRQGAPPFSLLVLFGIGCAMLAALLLGQLTGNWVRGIGFGLGIGSVAESVTAWQTSAPVAVLLHEIGHPLALLLPIAIAGWIVDRRARWTTAATAAFALPTMAFILYWGVTERGGYMIAPALALAFAAARGCSTLRKGSQRALVLLAIATQAAVGYAFVHDYDERGFQIDERIDVLREALPNGKGWVLSAYHAAPSAKIHLPKLDEFDMLPSFEGITSVEDWWENKLRGEIVLAVASEGRFVLDRSYANADDVRGLMVDCLRHLEGILEERFELEKWGRSDWDMWVVTGKR